MRVCSVEGCERKHDSKGLCKTHAWRFRKHGSTESHPTGRRPIPSEHRFWEKVDKTPGQGPNGDCWEWQGAHTVLGYGVFYVDPNRRAEIASRYACEVQNGVPEVYRWACHRCDNPPCCRGEHLFWGTPADNTHDSMAKGRKSTPPVKKARKQ